MMIAIFERKDLPCHCHLRNVSDEWQNIPLSENKVELQTLWDYCLLILQKQTWKLNMLPLEKENKHPCLTSSRSFSRVCIWLTTEKDRWLISKIVYYIGVSGHLLWSEQHIWLGTSYRTIHIGWQEKHGMHVFYNHVNDMNHMHKYDCSIWHHEPISADHTMVLEHLVQPGFNDDLNLLRPWASHSSIKVRWSRVCLFFIVFSHLLFNRFFNDVH